MNTNISILIVDDHPLFREGLKSMLERDRQFVVVGEAGNGQDGFLMARELKPDIILMDISLPDTDGIRLTGELRKILPGTRIVMISMHSKTDYIVEAFQAGANGYISKDSAAEMLIPGLRSVYKGQYFIDNSISHKVVAKLSGVPVVEKKVPDDDYNSLTSREQEVMRLLAEGRSPREISERFCISPKTVENHRSNIMRKLKLKGSMSLIRYAAKIGLIDVDLWK